MTAAKLRNGDYVPDGVGGFASASGAEAVLERVYFLLTARRGKFPLLPEVGSRLHQIFREKPSARGALGASYAAEALAGERDLRVLGVVWEEKTQTLTVSVAWEDERLDVTLDASDLVIGT